MTIAAVLIITDLSLLGLGVSTVYRTVRQPYVCPLMGGIAIRDMNAEDVTTLGRYVPAQYEERYSLQSSYSFVYPYFYHNPAFFARDCLVSMHWCIDDNWRR